VLSAGGRAGNDRVVTGLGNDAIFVGRGTATVDGGDGIDSLEADFSASAAGVANTAAVVIDLQANTSAVAGSSISNIERFSDLRTGGGADVITTRTDLLTDVVYGGAGDDVITFQGGHDSVAGESGFDRLVLNWAGAGDRAVGTARFDGDNGTFVYTTGDNAYRVDGTGIDAFTITTANGADGSTSAQATTSSARAVGTTRSTPARVTTRWTAARAWTR
jgi:Ca2+-binding RTX toxin-like protein